MPRTFHVSLIWRVLLLAMAAMLSGQAFAQESQADSKQIELSSTELEWIRNHPSLKIAVMDAWPPMDFLAEDGKPSGIGVDFLKVLAKRAGLNVQIVAAPFKQNMEDVREKRINALMDVTPKPDREEFLSFTKPYLTIPHVLICRSDGPSYKSERDLSGKTVALEAGFFGIQHFVKNYPDVTVLEYPDTASCLVAVSQGEADAYAGNRAVATYLIAQEVLTNLETTTELKYTSSILAIGVRKDQQVLANILDKALASLTASEKIALLRNWTGNTRTKRGFYEILLTPEEEDWIHQHPVIHLGVDPDYVSGSKCLRMTRVPRFRSPMKDLV